MNRRQFLSTVAGTALVVGSACSTQSSDVAIDSVSLNLPRLHGFNLLEMFNVGSGYQRYREQDFDMIAEWGFNFVRLPCSYWFWAEPDPSRWLEIDTGPIEDNIARAIKLAGERGIHVNLNIHRAPGYCVNPPAEPLDLWESDIALNAAAHHWRYFADRFKDVPATDLSFNLLNEPPDISDAVYHKVHDHLIASIRDIDPTRPITIDGKMWGHTPVSGPFGPNVAFSTRGYSPRGVTHYEAPWLDDQWVEPDWPLKTTRDDQVIVVDKATLRREGIEPFQKIPAPGMGVHVGEFGCYNRTPHDVVLKWMIDNLALWKEAGWGWALWNLRGEFGVLDSGRSDVTYDNFRGHKLDARMLELLRNDILS
jgi:endoglucanase